jgi:methyl-accepting chemotaxis protein
MLKYLRAPIRILFWPLTRLGALGARLSIKTKLLLAFASVGATTAIVGALGWFFLAQVGSLMDTVAQRNIPEVVASLQLQARSEAVAAAAPVLLSAGNDAERQRHFDALQEKRKAVAGAMTEFLRHSHLEDDMAKQQMDQLLEETATKVNLLNTSVENRFKLAASRVKLMQDIALARVTFREAAEPAINRINGAVTKAASGEDRAASGELAKIVSTQFPALQALSDLTMQVNAVLAVYADTLAATEIPELHQQRQKYEAARKNVESLLESVEKSAKIDGLADAVKMVLVFGEGDEAIFDKRRIEIAAGRSGSLVLDQTRSLALRFGLAVEQIVAGVKERTDESVQRSDAMITTGRLITLVMSAASLVSSLLFVWLYVGRNVMGRITGLNRNMSALASGDLATNVAGAESKDEIGEMARSLLVFRDNMQRTKSLAEEQETAQERRNARVKRVEELTQGFDERISGALKTVDAAVGDMNGSAEAMAGVAEDTNRRSSAVAAAAGQASSNVQTVASATEELSASISEISRHVSQSAKIAGQAVEQANQTNNQVEQLSEAAQKIGDVVKLINDIAGQTNLLALNATIEAARAGDAGKGFAVVASEVKSLATQTAKATEDIASQIGAIQTATQGSVLAIQAIAKTIAEINEIAATVAAAVEEQGAATQEIARNVQQAATGTGEVTSNIGGVTEAAAKTGDAAQNVRASAAELARQSEVLRGEVDRFLAAVKAA